MAGEADLDSELAPFDFVLILNQEWFQDAGANDAQRRALVDHELCHGAVRLDRDGEPVVDARGRACYRTRKHDLEEFSEVVRRHGIWQRDIEAFYAALKAGKQKPLWDEPQPTTPSPSPAASPPRAH